MTFKDFSIFSSGGHLVYRSRTILAILVGSHRGNIPIKFESHSERVQEELAFKQIIHDFLFLALAAIFSSKQTVLAILVEGQIRNIL